MELKRVEIISSEVVKPARCHENPPKFKLTPFDNGMAMVPYQQRILFYKPLQAEYVNNRSHHEFIELLKRSLAEVLVVFYPLAGRITSDEDGSPVIDCGAGQSVRFIQASTDSALDQLGEFSQPSDFSDSLCDMDSGIPKHPWTLEDPLLLVQVTRFSCGGLSLGFAFNHQAMDGTSAWHFMNSWAEVARIGEVQAPPNISFSARTPDLTREQLEVYKQILGLHLPTTGIPSKTQGLNLVTNVFNLEPKLIQRLKADAAAATNQPKLSTFVVIGAYFWRRIGLARQLPADETSRFFVAVNSRGRVRTVPQHYFGNAASAFAVSLKAGEIDFAGCSAILHEGIQRCSEESLLGTVAYFKWALNHPEELKELNFWHNVVHPVGSHNHPVYKTEFGFGKPVGVTIGRGDIGDGKLYLFASAKGDGGVSVLVVLPDDVMGRLSDQEEL